MKGRLAIALGLAALFVMTAAAPAGAEYFDNAARAARANNAGALREILAGEDAKPNQTDDEQRTAMHYAAVNGNTEIIAILVKAAPSSTPPTRWAIRRCIWRRTEAAPKPENCCSPPAPGSTRKITTAGRR